MARRNWFEPRHEADERAALGLSRREFTRYTGRSAVKRRWIGARASADQAVRRFKAWRYDRRERSTQRSYARYMRRGGWSNGRECYKCGREGHFALTCRNAHR